MTACQSSGDQRRTLVQIVDSPLIVPSLDVRVPQMENQLVEACLHLDLHIPEQAIEVPKISSSSRHSCKRQVLLVPQTAEQLVEVPTIVCFYSLHGRVEQTVDIPVPRGGGLLRSRPRQVSTASSSHSRGAADEVLYRVFRTFLQQKKCEVESVLGVETECGLQFIHPAAASP